MLILIWEKLALILSTWDYTFFLFNWLGKGGGGLATPKGGVGESLGEVGSLIDSLYLGSSESLDELRVIRERHTSFP